MRKIIIDTDTGSDDAVGIMLAVLSGEIEVLGLTTVAGNCTLDYATKNALMTLEVCGRSDIPVYMGAYRPLYRDTFDAVDVHGKDGMGDLDLIHPTTKAKELHAVEYILDTVRQNPGEIEIIALGPATNLALAIMKDPDTMSKVKKIISMGTAGYGKGNCTVVAEFNVYADAESYKIMLESGIPTVIAGFDICLGEAAFNEKEIDMLLSSGRVANFAMRCNNTLIEFNRDREHKGTFLDLPDAVAVAVALWDDVIIKANNTACFCCIANDPSYGQVIVGAEKNLITNANSKIRHSTDVVETFDAKLYKKRLIDILVSAK